MKIYPLARRINGYNVMSENIQGPASGKIEAGPPPFTEQTVRDWRFR